MCAGRLEKHVLEGHCIAWSSIFFFFFCSSFLRFSSRSSRSPRVTAFSSLGESPSPSRASGPARNSPGRSRRTTHAHAHSERAVPTGSTTRRRVMRVSTAGSDTVDSRSHPLRAVPVTCVQLKPCPATRSKRRIVRSAGWGVAERRGWMDEVGCVLRRKSRLLLIQPVLQEKVAQFGRTFCLEFKKPLKTFRFSLQTGLRKQLS